MSFTRPTSIRNAYLGKHALDLVRVTSDQVADVYVKRGIAIPVELSSTLHSLSYRDGASLTDIAVTLDLPHQLVAQRVGKLLDRGLIKRRPDPDDKRRTKLCLTRQGVEQAHRLRQCMRDMAEVYGALYDEIGCDLPAVLTAALDAIASRPLVERFADMGLLEDKKNDEEVL